jgi:uncharacterized membrane protein
MLVDVAVRVAHQLFAAIWVGATVYVTFAVLPTLRDGEGDTATVERLSSRFTALSVVSVIVLFLTGGHLAGTLYTFEGLLETTRGNLVLTMLALWFLLAVVLHIGTRKLDSGVEEGRLREPASAAFPWYVVGSVLGVALLFNGVLFAYV